MMENQILIILGSSRNDGNTRQMVNFLKEKLDAEFVDLMEHDFSYYDYEYKNAGDDFQGIAEKMLDYHKIIFCTPVYWYAMSAVMKTFFDRFSDLVTGEKSVGRKLAGKKMFALCCSSDGEEHEGFFMPFEKTAAYLDMNYGGSVHTWIEANEIPKTVVLRLNQFCQQVLK